MTVLRETKEASHFSEKAAALQPQAHTKRVHTLVIVKMMLSRNIMRSSQSKSFLWRQSLASSSLWSCSASSRPKLQSVSALSCLSGGNENHCSSSESGTSAVIALVMAAAAATATSAVSHSGTISTATTLCEEAASATAAEATAAPFTPATVAKEDFDELQQSHVAIEELPEYTADELAAHNGDDGSEIWMSYGGVVYNVTDFIANHPGGSEKILTAAGSAIEPFWYVYRQHFSSDLPMRLMEHMAIGRLAQADQDQVDAQMELLHEDDPYAYEPTTTRSELLKVHSDAPCNAEVPSQLITQNYLTPNDLFYIRNHHPVPHLTEQQIRDYRLVVDLTAHGGTILKLSLHDLKQLPSTTVTCTLQCSGNRRGGYNAFQRTSGTPWGQGAVSTAEFTGVRLAHVLQLAGLDDPVAAQEEHGMEHVRFHALDGMMASIGIAKAANYYDDCILAYEMNGEPLPRDHGFPVRGIVPGYAAVRNVKWLQRIELAKEEAEGPWQRGLNYKILPPAVHDAKTVQVDDMPSVTEPSLFSGITTMERTSTESLNPGDRTTIKVGGWAWAGGGRNIVRVDVTGDNGTTWVTATLKDGADQRFGRAWAWVFWECEMPCTVNEDGSIHVASKAVDLCFNVQPESSHHSWNVRGLGNNSWYRAHAKVLLEEQ